MTTCTPSESTSVGAPPPARHDQTARAVGGDGDHHAREDVGEPGRSAHVTLLRIGEVAEGLPVAATRRWPAASATASRTSSGPELGSVPPPVNRPPSPSASQMTTASHDGQHHGRSRQAGRGRYDARLRRRPARPPARSRHGQPLAAQERPQVVIDRWTASRAARTPCPRSCRRAPSAPGSRAARSKKPGSPTAPAKAPGPRPPAGEPAGHEGRRPVAVGRPQQDGQQRVDDHGARRAVEPGRRRRSGPSRAPRRTTTRPTPTLSRRRARAWGRPPGDPEADRELDDREDAFVAVPCSTMILAPTS